MPDSPIKSNSVELCHAGQLLEVELKASSKMLYASTQRMERGNDKILKALANLMEYATRDKEKLETLEKRCDGFDKSRACVHQLKQDFKQHMGEFEATKRAEDEKKQLEIAEGRNAGRKYGTSSGIISGITSGITTAFLTFWYWFTHHGGPQ